MVILKYIYPMPNNFTGKIGKSNDYKFYKNNKLHRVFGPATSQTEGYVSFSVSVYCTYLFVKEYYINGSFKGMKASNNFSHSKFLKDLSKSWLL